METLATPGSARRLSEMKQQSRRRSWLKSLRRPSRWSWRAGDGLKRFAGPLVVLLASVVEAAAMAVFGLTSTHHDVIGVTGAVAVLVAILTAIMAGPVAGGLVAVVGGGAFFVFISDMGSTAPLLATLVATAVWGMAAVVAGLLADRLRRAEEARQEAQVEAAALHARLEANLLPNMPRQVANLQLLTKYIPSEQRLGIGGDFFDAVDLGKDGLALVIGDVVGHGPDAAALGALLRISWHALVPFAPPAELVAALERVLVRERVSEDAYATLCLAWIREGGTRAELLLLGHLPPLLVTHREVVSLPLEPALPLGLVNSRVPEPQVVALPEGWSLFFYTDGLVEGRATPQSSERYGTDRLVAALRHRADGVLSAEDLDRVIAAVVRAHGGPLPDDVAVMQVSGGLPWREPRW
jgi:serine phosphatase RsbU (regulator of sigma subunit)